MARVQRTRSADGLLLFAFKCLRLSGARYTALEQISRLCELYNRIVSQGRVAGIEIGSIRGLAGNWWQ